MKMVKVVRLNLIYSLSESRGGSLLVEGNELPVLMLDFACGKGRVLLVNDVPVVVCVFGLQCDAVASGAYDMKVSTVNIFKFFCSKHVFPRPSGVCVVAASCSPVTHLSMPYRYIYICKYIFIYINIVAQIYLQVKRFI